MGEWSPFRAYSRKVSRFCWQDLLTALLIFSGAAWLYFTARSLPAYAWNWRTCLEYLLIITAQGDMKAGLLLQGLFTTIRVGCWTFLFSLLLGSCAGLIAVHKGPCFNVPYQILINVIRDTPPLVLLFCVYFLLGNILPLAPIEDAIRRLPAFIQSAIAHLFAEPGQMDRMFSAILALGLYQGAYVAEIIRGSMENVPSGQWDAGLALGFGRGAVLRMIIIPQGLRSALPPLTGQCISTFKESSLASLISVPDLTFQSLEIMAISGMTFEIWICAGILYLLLGLFCALIGGLLERHYSRFLN